MPQSYGKIKKGDSTIIENIPIWIDFKIDPRSKLSKWHGSLTLLNEKNISPADNPYRLILDDGRSGDIIITNLKINSSGRFVIIFQGSGGLS
jgi:hypothetical protein